MWDFDWITQPEAWALLVLLTFLEIVLGVDNLLFISLITRRLPSPQAIQAQRLGLGLAAVFRLLLLAGLSYVIYLDTPVLSVKGYSLSWKDLILIGGGIFLVAKSTHEIHQKVIGVSEMPGTGAATSFRMVLFQILAIDTVFSIDSILTAVGLTEEMMVIAIAIVAAVGVMVAFAEVVSSFLRRYPTFQMLALSFLILIGVLLMVEGFHYHVPRGYVYFALSFSLMVEVLNIRVQRRRQNKSE